MRRGIAGVRRDGAVCGLGRLRAWVVKLKAEAVDSCMLEGRAGAATGEEQGV